MPDEFPTPDERMDPPADPPPAYEPPEAEELPSDQTAGTAPGVPPQTGGDFAASDRDLKTQVEAVDPDAVLAGVMELPVSSWSYREDDPRVRHVGPMAQDFAAAFGVGDDDRRIHPVDANGVALAAIQALAARLAAAEARIAELTPSVEDLS